MMLKEQYIANLSKHTGFPKKDLEDLWEQCKKTVVKEKSSKKYWNNVKKLFKEKVEEKKLKEGQSIMENREKLQTGIRHLLDNLATEKYDITQKSLKDTVNYALKEIINKKKGAYAEELSRKAAQLAKEG